MRSPSEYVLLDNIFVVVVLVLFNLFPRKVGFRRKRKDLRAEVVYTQFLNSVILRIFIIYF